jgi:hypothetical protein
LPEQNFASIVLAPLNNRAGFEIAREGSNRAFAAAKRLEFGRRATFHKKFNYLTARALNFLAVRRLNSQANGRRALANGSQRVSDLTDGRGRIQMIDRACALRRPA